MEQKPLVSEKALQILREYITMNRCEQPVKIPSEREFAKTLLISRVTMRIAIKRLVEEGLLTQAQGKGTYITPQREPMTLHILCPPDSKKTDPFYNKFLVEITREAARKGLLLYMIDTDTISWSRRQEPLITIGMMEKQLMDELIQDYETILSIQDFSEHSNAIQLLFDDYAIGRQAGELLLTKGHSELLHLAGPEKYPSAVLRKQGFQDSITKAGCRYQELTTKMNWQGGYSAGDSVLSMLAGINPPTAVFTANDAVAIGLIQRLREKGVNVPKDLSVIGCDDIQLASEAKPGLTTFNLDMKLIINEIFVILNRKKHGEPIDQKIRIAANLVERESLLDLNNLLEYNRSTIA